MDMEPQATLADQSLDCSLFEVAKIYSDPDFNCRGQISALDVFDLAKDIAKRGLLQPIVVRPRLQSTPKEYDYVVVAGHRRLKSYVINNAPLIPGILREVDEFEARSINAIENIKRKDLNMLQEARTVEHFRLAGWSREDVATELGVSSGWVQVRYMVLDLPEELQNASAAGFFTQTQIRDLNGIKDSGKQMEVAKKLKEAKQRGDSVTVQAKLRKSLNPNSTRTRTKADIFILMDEIVKVCDGNNFATRCLAWAAGQISDLDLYESLEDHCKRNGFHYSIPEMD